MKKIFYIINVDIRNKKAHTIQILNTVENINSINRDVNISIVCPDYNYFFDNKDFFESKKNVNVIFLKNFLFSKINRISYYFFLFRSIFFVLYQKIKKNIDAVYLRDDNFFILVLLCRIFKIPVFFEIHRKHINFLSKIKKKFIVSLSLGVIVITNNLKEYYKRYNKNIIVAHDGVDFKKFCLLHLDKNYIRKKIDLNYNKIALYSGTISEKKGCLDILHIARLNRDVDFVLVGNYDDNLFNILNSEPNIHLIGFVENDKVPYYLRSADLLLLTHKDKIFFQSPMKLFEYLASGTCILSFRLNNIEEVLGADYQFFYSDIDSFSKKIKSFFSCNYYNLQICKQNIRIAKKYDWKERAKKISLFLSDLLSQ